MVTSCVGTAFLKHVIGDKTEVAGRRGRRCKQQLGDLKEMRRCSKLKEEAIYRTVWRTRFGKGYGPVVRQVRDDDDDDDYDDDDDDYDDDV